MLVFWRTLRIFIFMLFFKKSLRIERNFVKDNLTFDYEKLIEITKVITRNLNKVIDINYYPVDEAKNSNLQHRPIGIGV